MHAFRIARAFTFNGVEITVFFKTINKIFATYDIIED